jgi:hypothetical protein
MMQDNKYIGPDGFAEILTDLLERTKRIKTMLWAGDSAAARGEIEGIKQSHEKFIIEPLRVKAIVQSRSRLRKIKAEAQQKYSEERVKGWDLDYLKGTYIATRTSLPDETTAALFALAPVASLITKLDKRISGETEKQPVFNFDATSDDVSMLLADNTTASQQPTETDYDPTTGFRLLVFPRTDETWEVRGYQFDPPDLKVLTLTEELKALPETFIERIDESQDEQSWPVTIQGFSQLNHFKLTILEPGRFSLFMVLRRGEDPSRWFHAILDAIGKGQVGRSPVDSPHTP